MGIMDETRSIRKIAGQTPERPTGLRYVQTWRRVWAGLAGLSAAFLLGCQTDQVAQESINQMRAEQIALEDRYASLRNEYEKLRNRLAARGDAESKNPAYPSALPLTYPPGQSPVDLELGDPLGDQAWSMDAGLELSPTNDPARTPIPQLGSQNSVLESNTPQVAPTAIPTKVYLVEPSTRVTPGANPNTYILRLVTQVVTDLGEPANPIGTYSLRLIDPRRRGADSMIGSWQFPAEKIRTFASNTAQVANGMPLEVSFSFPANSPPELIAEIEFHPVAGSKLTCRGFVGGSPNGEGQTKPWIDTLPVPQDSSGLMRGSSTAKPGQAASSSPTWSPVR